MGRSILDYLKFNKSRLLDRKKEEYIRAKASKLHKTATLKNALRTGFRLKKIHEAHKYLKGSNKLIQHACDLYLTEKLKAIEFCTKMKLNRTERRKFIEKYIEKFKKIDEKKLSEYISAAIIDDPKNEVIIASKAYHVFLGIHVSHLKTSLRLDIKDLHLDEDVQKQAKLFWRSMSSEEKFPFFLLSYLNTYYPRGIDGSTMYTFNKMNQSTLNQSLKEAESVYEKFENQIKNEAKHVRFNPHKQYSSSKSKLNCDNDGNGSNDDMHVRFSYTNYDRII